MITDIAVFICSLCVSRLGSRLCLRAGTGVGTIRWISALQSCLPSGASYQGGSVTLGTGRRLWHICCLKTTNNSDWLSTCQTCESLNFRKKTVEEDCQPCGSVWDRHTVSQLLCFDPQHSSGMDLLGSSAEKPPEHGSCTGPSTRLLSYCLSHLP